MVSRPQPPLRLQRLLDPLEVAALPVHVGLLDLDIVEPGQRIELDRAHLGALADHLLVDLAVGRHVDDDVALKLRLTGQPPARLQAPACPGSAARPPRMRVRCSAVLVMPCLAKLPSPTVTWHRPQIARPPHTESMSTPSWRAAVRTGVPSAKRPRLPEGVKTTSASFIRCLRAGGAVRLALRTRTRQPPSPRRAPRGSGSASGGNARPCPASRRHPSRPASPPGAAGS